MVYSPCGCGHGQASQAETAAPHAGGRAQPQDRSCSSQRLLCSFSLHLRPEGMRLSGPSAPAPVPARSGTLWHPPARSTHDGGSAHVHFSVVLKAKSPAKASPFGFSIPEAPTVPFCKQGCPCPCGPASPRHFVRPQVMLQHPGSAHPGVRVCSSAPSVLKSVVTLYKAIHPLGQIT